MQDYISMVLIWYATQTRENNTETLSADLIESLIRMEKQLNEVV